MNLFATFICGLRNVILEITYLSPVKEKTNLKTVNKLQGFTLVEALVALVILSAIFSVTWGWFNTAVRNSVSIERAVRLPLLFDEFTDRLSLVDLQNTRNGKIEIDNFTLIWDASEVRLSTQEYFRRQERWVVALFDINVEIRDGQKLVETFRTQQAAQWRDPNYIGDPFEGF